MNWPSSPLTVLLAVRWLQRLRGRLIAGLTRRCSHDVSNAIRTESVAATPPMCCSCHPFQKGDGKYRDLSLLPISLLSFSFSFSYSSSLSLPHSPSNSSSAFFFFPSSLFAIPSSLSVMTLRSSLLLPILSQLCANLPFSAI